MTGRLKPPQGPLAQTRTRNQQPGVSSAKDSVPQISHGVDRYSALPVEFFHLHKNNFLVYLIFIKKSAPMFAAVRCGHVVTAIFKSEDHAQLGDKASRNAGLRDALGAASAEGN
jgi:hypothetical protein